MKQKWARLIPRWVRGWVRDFLSFPFTIMPVFQKVARCRAGLWASVDIYAGDDVARLIPLHADNIHMTHRRKRDKNFPPYLYYAPSDPAPHQTPLFFIICDKDNRIIAGATVRPHRLRIHEMVITQISVHRLYRNQGYATRLLVAIRDEINMHHPSTTRVTISPFMPLGIKFLRPTFIRIAGDLKTESFEMVF